MQGGEYHLRSMSTQLDKAICSSESCPRKALTFNKHTDKLFRSDVKTTYFGLPNSPSSY